MSGQNNENDQDRQPDDHAADDSDSEDLTERISEALAPALSSVSVRVAEAITASLTSSQSGEQDGGASDDQPPESQASEGGDAGESSSPELGDDRQSDDQTLIGKAASGLKSSFFGSLKDEGGDQLESIVDSAVENLFSRGARGVARRLGDETLQAALHDTVKDIDDPSERHQLYRDTLRKLRPIVRDAVDAMYTWDSRETLKRHLHGAIPSIMNGDFQTAFRMIIDALSDITNRAEEVVWENSGEVLRVFQQLSTELLEDEVQDQAREKINPEEIQERVQQKAEEARSKLQETVGSLQEGIQHAQKEIGGRIGGGRRGGPGMPPSSQPPNGLPPFGQPPSGQPPSGLPPSGRPPSGVPPSGLPPNGVHPSVARMNSQQNRRSGNGPRRRTPEA